MLKDRDHVEIYHPMKAGCIDLDTIISEQERSVKRTFEEWEASLKEWGIIEEPLIGWITEIISRGNINFTVWPIYMPATRNFRIGLHHFNDFDVLTGTSERPGEEYLADFIDMLKRFKIGYEIDEKHLTIHRVMKQ